MKGAARIVGLNDAVALAHAMEDLLVSCQKGEVVLDSTQIDLLLSSTDIYKDVSLLDTDEIQDFLADKKPFMDQMEKALRGDEQAVKDVCAEVCPSGIPTRALDADELKETQLENEPPLVSAPEQQKKKKALAPKKRSSKPTAAKKDSVVRVSAGNLNRLMALAGESLVESGKAW